MADLQLDENEARVVAELLESAISDLGYEIANTDAADYRDGLKSKKATASEVLKRLQAASA